MKSHGKSTDGGRLGQELLGLFAIFCGLLVILGLATFDSRDPWLNHVVSGTVKVHNKAGLFGAYLAGLLYDILGAASWTIPACFCLAGARWILGAKPWDWWRWAGCMLLGFIICLAGAASDLGDVEIFARGNLPQGAGNVSTHGGGIVGHMLYGGMVGWMSSTGTFLVWLFCLILAMQMLTGISWLNLLMTGSSSLWQSVTEKRKETLAKRAERKEAHRALVHKPYKEQPLEVEVVPVQENGPAVAIHGPYYEDSLALTATVGHDSGAYIRSESSTASDNSGAADSAVEPARPDLFRVPHSSEQGLFFSLEDDMEASQVPSRQSADFPAATFSESSHVPSVAETDHTLLPGRAEEEEEDLPPWVRDFEEDRLGVPPHLIARSMTIPEERNSLAGSSFEVAGEDQADEAFAPLREADALNVSRQSFSGPSATTAAPFLQKETAAASSLDTVRVFEPVPDSFPELQAEATVAEVLEEERRVEAQEPDEQSGAVPIFEPPPLEPARKAAPVLVHAVIQRIKKPVRAPLPPLELLEAAKKPTGGTPRSVLEEKGKSLMTCLQDFGIQGELAGITPGPVVTMFEVRPAPGVRVSRIANLNDDLALALKAVAVRIQAPVPGTDAVGIEIPNAVRETVCLKELLGSQLFQQSKSLLTLALGKDVAGMPAVADLATMPHLLVAGATGAGKSVGINSIILSLLYKARPEEVKLLLIDPKRVEMAIYADLPHLVHPVVTEMQLAKNALEWAVSEMEQRYNAIARAGVRNIGDYNAKVASWNGSPPEGMDGLEFMPYLVLIIDELADLMLVAAKEVETSIVRLAQLARAAGIHLILATQRPSVDVVTGLIKANFPCRISFQVTSKHDSRTILDAVGAEHLLGKGDMLFKPGGGKFRRMHGAFVNDKNVTAVVSYWKTQQKPDYHIDFSDWAPEGASSMFAGGGSSGDVAADPLYNEAVEFVRQQGKASISLIQRKFRIGFNKAARFVEQMEQDGIIGPADGSKPRLVIR